MKPKHLTVKLLISFVGLIILSVVIFLFKYLQWEYYGLKEYFSDPGTIPGVGGILGILSCILYFLFLGWLWKVKKATTDVESTSTSTINSILLAEKQKSDIPKEGQSIAYRLANWSYIPIKLFKQSKWESQNLSQYIRKLNQLDKIKLWIGLALITISLIGFLTLFIGSHVGSKAIAFSVLTLSGALLISTIGPAKNS